MIAPMACKQHYVRLMPARTSTPRQAARPEGKPRGRAPTARSAASRAVARAPAARAAAPCRRPPARPPARPASPGRCRAAARRRRPRRPARSAPRVARGPAEHVWQAPRLCGCPTACAHRASAPAVSACVLTARASSTTARRCRRPEIEAVPKAQWKSTVGSPDADKTACSQQACTPGDRLGGACAPRRPRPAPPRPPRTARAAPEWRRAQRGSRQPRSRPCRRPARPRRAAPARRGR